MEINSKGLAVLLWLLTRSTFADPAIPPEKCPSLSAVQSVGLNHVKASNSFGWITAYKPGSKYDTDDDWYFIVTGGAISAAANAKDALNKARKALYVLGDPLGPSGFMDGWVCRYDTISMIVAMAFTPPVSPFPDDE